MARKVVLLLALAASPAWASALEVELGGGGAAWQTFTPALTGRLGLDWDDHLTTSIRVLTLTGLKGQTPTGTISDVTSGYQAWAALAELRLHTSGTFQLSAGAGLGLGQPSVSDAWSVHPSSEQAPTAPYAQGSLGARVVIASEVWISSELTYAVWNPTLDLGPSPFAPQNAPTPSSSESGWLLTFGLGGRLPL